MRIYRILILLFLVTACSPYVHHQLNRDRPKHKSYDLSVFALITKDTVEISDTSLVGTIEIAEEGFTINCDYETIIRLSVDEAKLLGGNCLVITKHKPPDGLSTCHRIKGNVYYISNPRQYEKYISWSPDRRLEPLDYKGSESDEKESFSRVICYLKGYRDHFEDGQLFTIGIENFFFCEVSYLNEFQRDSFALTNENLYFDIAELYRRELYRKIREELFSYNQLVGQLERVQNELMEECQAMQWQCSREISKDTSKQKYWTDWVKKELLKLEPYNKLEIELPLNPVDPSPYFDDRD